MKKIYLLFSLFVFMMPPAHSQEYSYKYGKITNDEINMTVYQKDTTASAVVIYDDGYTKYGVLNNRFQLTTEYKKKIKILKQTGINEANIDIPYYYKSSTSRESIAGIEAFSYTLENAKIVKTKLERKYIFDEEMSDRYRRIKFSIPNVKVGSVIELKFSKSTDLVYGIDPWGIQGDIPVNYSYYEVVIPEYLKFNIDTKGFEKIDVVETSENQQFVLSGSTSANNLLTCTSRYIKFTAKDIPALKDENYVWCVNDFLSGIRFELKATNFPNEFYKPYSQTWEDLEKVLIDETDFGKNLKISNPFKDVMTKELASVTDEKEKIAKIYEFVKNHISWNEKYSFHGNNAKDAVKLRTGDNGQINMILLSALKDAKIKAYPVLISRRSLGRLPFTYASYDQLNTFIVAAETSSGKVYYMDGSAIHGGLNMLPVDLLVDRARIFDNEHTEKWVDITSIERNQKIRTVNVEMNEDGNMSGLLNTVYTYQDAYLYKQQFEAAKDSADFVESFENTNHVNVDTFRVEQKNPMSNIVKEKIFFSKTNESAGEYIYLNPMIFTHLSENEFIQPERKLPIEFNYPSTYMLSCNITLPDNYEVIEIPKSIKLVLNENCKCIYVVKQNANVLNLSYRFDMNQTIFPTTEYQAIREYFGQIATKNQEMLVLKKVTTK